MNKLSLCFVIALSAFFTTASAQPIPYSKGRIAISCDGNEHDRDDWSSSATHLALLAAAGLQDALSLMTYSDHIWGSGHQNPPRQDRLHPVEEMRLSVLGTKDVFGFTSATNFVEAVADPNAAYNAMRDEILASTAANPLIILAAGPMQVIGVGMNRASNHADYTDQFNHVLLISHGGWNENHADKPKPWESHSGWTKDEIVAAFGPLGLTFRRITGGNDELNTNESHFDWILTSPCRNDAYYGNGAAWDYWYSRILAADKSPKIDISDSTMTAYAITGIENSTPYMLQELMERPCDGTTPPPSDYFFIEHNSSGRKLAVLNDATDDTLKTNPSGNTGNWVQWKEEPVTGDWFYLINKATGKKLKSSDGTALSVEDPSQTGQALQWRWVDAGDGWSRLENRSHVKWLHVKPDGVTDLKLGPTGWTGNNTKWKATAVVESATVSQTAMLSEVALYPSPASGILTIEGTSAGSEIEIFDTDGSKTHTTIASGKTSSIDVSSLTSGVYSVKISNANESSSHALLVE